MLVLADQKSLLLRILYLAPKLFILSVAKTTCFPPHSSLFIHEPIKFRFQIAQVKLCCNESLGSGLNSTLKNRKHDNASVATGHTFRCHSSWERLGDLNINFQRTLKDINEI